MVNGRWARRIRELGTLTSWVWVWGGREQSLVMTGLPFKRERSPVRRRSGAPSAYLLAGIGKAPKPHGDKVVAVVIGDLSYISKHLEI